jgi:hypothetical protein
MQNEPLVVRCGKYVRWARCVVRQRTSLEQSHTAHVCVCLEAADVTSKGLPTYFGSHRSHTVQREIVPCSVPTSTAAACAAHPAGGQGAPLLAAVPSRRRERRWWRRERLERGQRGVTLDTNPRWFLRRGQLPSLVRARATEELAAVSAVVAADAEREDLRAPVAALELTVSHPFLSAVADRTLEHVSPRPQLGLSHRLLHKVLAQVLGLSSRGSKTKVCVSATRW